MRLPLFSGHKAGRNFIKFRVQDAQRRKQPKAMQDTHTYTLDLIAIFINYELAFGSTERIINKANNL